MVDAVVLGGTGFIGSRLTGHLADLGYEVRCVDFRELDSTRSDDVNKAAELIWADLRDPEECRDAIAGARWVFHLAADMGGVGYFHNHDFWPYINNARITMNVLEACDALETERLFYSSSACAYPTDWQTIEGRIPKLGESMLESGYPDQMYGREKLMGLRLCERAPFPARVGIFHTIYGPGQEHEGERMKFPAAVATKTLRAAKTGGPIEIWGNGEQARSYLYIDDALERIMAVMSSEVYEGPVNIGAQGAVTCNEVALVCADLAGITDPELSHTDGGPTGVISRDCDNAKFNNTYGEPEQTTIRDGFAGFMTWLDAVA